MHVRAVQKADDLSKPNPNRFFTWAEDENGELIEEDARRFEAAVNDARAQIQKEM